MGLQKGITMNWANYVGRILILLGMVGFIFSLVIRMHDKINGGDDV